ncbi:MAG: PIN domain nuclease of toxin-antitoxin system [Candidatus Binatia bacterium]|jgi:PIN domain nuclease of toxin-antitoxin system
MRLLLDTCVFIWLTSEPSRLSQPAIDALDSPANALFLSHASIWEIYLKCGAGKLTLPTAPEPWIAEQLAARQVAEQAIDLPSLSGTLKLPGHHRDPFDRLLIAQARTHSMTLVSPDPWIGKYDANLIW